ncbi:BRE1-domain-containing protein [Cristinia sonorae]|uniref:E3 ubiquitin protein ligase n=1 Tax=Cristinia sonorae TaxID=1940300 RepID=A0A8K0UJH1_9AGAR|nr:BRE1-domain-containing protein [Cristinia sonorae]
MATVESRKRARTEDGEGARAKKRAVTEDHHSSDYVNHGITTATATPNDADDPKDNDDLEMFRKDAIYRRMKHYSRENERNLVKIAELERRRHTCEAGMAALEACWSQIVGTIKSLVKPENLPEAHAPAEEIYDLSANVSSESDPTYVDSLKSQMQATQHLITAFVQLGGNAQALLTTEEVYKQCQRAQTDCSSLRSEMSLIRARLKSSESDNERLQEELVAAHTRIDRLQSKTVASLNNTSKTSHGGGGSGGGEVKKDEGSATPSSPHAAGSGAATVNGIHSALEPVTSGNPTSQDTDAKEMEVDMTKSVDDAAAEWRAIAEVREKKLEELRQECVELRDEVEKWKATAKAPTAEFIQETAVYEHLFQIARDLVVKDEARGKEVAAAKEEVDALAKMKQEWLDDLTSQHEKAISDYKNRLDTTTGNLVRVREQRDQCQAELSERKAKDGVKFASMNEWRTLANLRGDRISALLSEVTRLKARLAADTGNEDLVAFLFQNAAKDNLDCDQDSTDSSYMHDLQQRLSAAESRVAALEATLSQVSGGQTDVAAHLRAEADARQQVSQLKSKLREYEEVFGTTDKEEAIKKLESEVKRLRVLEKQKDAAENALYVELDKLSAAWEGLDKQVKSKAFDLTAMEEKIQKTLVDRAKLENKFYAAMRDKEAVENERKNLARTVEKQAKMIEAMHESEKNARERWQNCESLNEQLKKAADIAKSNALTSEENFLIMRSKADDDHRHAVAVRALAKEQNIAIERRKAQVTRKEEIIARQKVETERLLNRAKEKADKVVASSNSNSREAELMGEVEKCMALLQCSTCKSNMRTTVITKCMHTFCKACVDSRIASRQRKCPACNVSFSQGEVQQLYFQ